MSALAPEPFVSFPLWGLRQAMYDHRLACPMCKTGKPDGCRQAWYLTLLERKITEATVEKGETR